jgi:Protein of unknown function (DUF1015)
VQTHFPSCDGSGLGVGLLLAPFRGVRYDLSRVGGLANVTSPPYDVIGPGTLERLRAASPYNVVRLILPADVPGGAAPGAGPAGAPGGQPAAGGEPAAGTTDDPGGRAAQARAAGRAAATLLHDWLGDGALAADDAPALYVYEQRASGWVQRGLIGLVAVGTDAVHPHEGVMPGLVAGRRELMKATRSNLEPILLVYKGGAGAGGHGGPAGPPGAPVLQPGASALTDRAADGAEPLVCAMTE